MDDLMALMADDLISMDDGGSGEAAFGVKRKAEDDDADEASKRAKY
jgi:hypothetical protein